MTDPIRKPGFVGPDADSVRVYEAVKDREYRAVLAYDELGAIAQVGNRRQIHALMRTVKGWLLERDRKCLRPLANVGYEIIHPEEQDTIADSKEKQAARALRRAHAILTHAAEELMSESAKLRRATKLTRVGQKRALEALVNRQSKALPAPNRLRRLKPEDFERTRAKKPPDA